MRRDDLLLVTLSSGRFTEIAVIGVHDVVQTHVPVAGQLADEAVLSPVGAPKGRERGQQSRDPASGWPAAQRGRDRGAATACPVYVPSQVQRQSTSTWIGTPTRRFVDPR